MRRILIGTLIVLAVLFCAGLLALRQPGVQMHLFKAIAAHEVRRPAPVLAKDDELSVLLCGTGTPLPDRRRAGPCALVAAGPHLYVIDTGIGSVRNLMLWRIALLQLDGIFITHFHSDHIPELAELNLQSWVAGRQAPMPVYGPPGVERVVNGFTEAYALDTGYRVEHHGADFLPPAAAAMHAMPVAIPADAGTAVVFEKDGLKVTAIRVHHNPATPAYGYRFDYHGRSVVISGDTTADENLGHAAKNADVLVHEGLNTPMVAALGDALAKAGKPRVAKIMHDIPGYHADPVAVARIANENGVKKLVFTHMLPLLPNFVAEDLFLDGVGAVRPHGVQVGHDGLLIRLPANSADIEETHLGD